MLYNLWNIGGAGLLIILNVIGIVGTFALLIQSSKKWGGPISQGFALLIAGHIMFQSMDVGPQTIMILFIALTLYLSTTLQKPAILFGALIPLEILWANMHSSFIYGPLIVGLAAAQVGQQNKIAGRGKKAGALTPGLFGLLALAMFIATVANPALFKLHAQTIANLQHSAPAYWSSIFIDYFQIPPLKPLIFFVIVLGASGLITLKKRLPWTLTGMAIYSAFIIIGPHSRMYLLFAVLTFPFMVLSLTAISGYLQASFKNLFGKKADLLGSVMAGVLGVLIVLSLIPVVSNCAYAKTGSASRFGLGIQEELFPAGAAEEIIAHEAFPETVINLAADGGYLAFKYNRKIFIDYRPGRYSKDQLTELANMMTGNVAAYNSLIEAHRPGAFIVNTLYPSSAQGIVTLLRVRNKEGHRLWRLAYLTEQPQSSCLTPKITARSLKTSPHRKRDSSNCRMPAPAYAGKSGSCTAGNSAELIGSGKVYLALNRPVESEYISPCCLKATAVFPAHGSALEKAS